MYERGRSVLWSWLSPLFPHYYNPLLQAATVEKLHRLLRAENKVISCYFWRGGIHAPTLISSLPPSSRIRIRGCLGKPWWPTVTSSLLLAGSCPPLLSWESAETQRRKPTFMKSAWMAGTPWCKHCRDHKVFKLKMSHSCRTLTISGP